jgi:hypothetical protein
MRRRLLSLLAVLLGLLACLGGSAGAESATQLVIVGVPGETSDPDPDSESGIKYDVADRDSWYTAELNGHVYCCFQVINAFTDPSKAGPLASMWGAERFCESLGGHLATLTSPEENSFVLSFAYHVTSGYIYFGLYYDWDDGSWKWVTGEPVEYTAWKTIEPDDPIFDDNSPGYARYKLNLFGNHVSYSTRWENAPMLLVSGNTYIGDSIFICEWDDLPLTDLCLSDDYWDTSLTGRLLSVEQDALVLCAGYGEDNRMMDMASVRIDADAEDRAFEFTFDGKAESVKLFVLDAETWTPICPAWESAPSTEAKRRSGRLCRERRIQG